VRERHIEKGRSEVQSDGAQSSIPCASHYFFGTASTVGLLRSLGWVGAFLAQNIPSANAIASPNAFYQNLQEKEDVKTELMI